MRIHFILFSALLISCASKTPKQEHSTRQKHPKMVFPAGQVIKSVACESDTTIRYALYLPAKYDTSGSYPVIFFFDAEARGELAVSRLKNIAGKLGYIVIGSLNSKNGLPPEQYDYIAGKLFDDASNKLSVDGRRLYTAGFSGGARQAMLLALKRTDITGVIGCSAGMPQWDQQLPSSFFYIGIAGKKDFNYSEMANLELQLAGSPLPHQFLYLDGIHEMPSSDEFSEVVTLLQINAIKTCLASRNDTLVNDFIKVTEKKIEKLTQRKLLVDAVHSYAMLVNQLDGLTNVAGFKKKMDELEKSSQFVLAGKQKEKADADERNLQQSYSQAFSGQDMNWWRKAISGLQVQSKSIANPYEALMKKRVLAYIALMAHMNYDAAVKQNATAKQKDFLDIKVLAEPEIPMGYYLQSVFYSRAGNQQEAAKMIRKAVSLGFQDEPKLVSEPLLAFIKSSPEYPKLLEKIRNNYKVELTK